MADKKISKAQLRALSAIHAFIEKNSLPPTLSELKTMLDYASDQSVIDVIKRLEKNGQIVRDTGVARGLQLTVLGKAQIGPDPADELQATNLLPHQKELYRNIAESYGFKIAQIYLGGIVTLNSALGPDFIAQAAHSIRELVMRIPEADSRLLNPEQIKKLKEDKRTNAMKLSQMHDPLGGNMHLEQNAYDIWNKKYHQYFIEVSHHQKDPSVEEFRVALTAYEDFLLRHIFTPQYNAYERVDTLTKEGPGNISADELRALITRNRETYSYFFRNADHTWLSRLQSDKLLAMDSEVMGYLARTADEHPSKTIFGIIKSFKLEQADWVTADKIINLSKKLPSNLMEDASKLFIQAKWLKTPHADLTSHALCGLLKKLLEKELDQAALALTSELLALQLVRGDATAYVADYQYETVAEVIRGIAIEKNPPFIDLLAQKLEEAMILEDPDLDPEDTSYIWHPAIEGSPNKWNHGAKNILIQTIRDMVDKTINESGAEESEKTAGPIGLEQLIKHKNRFAIFERLKIHLYRIHKDEYSSVIERLILEKMGDRYVWHEYALLIGEAFPTLSARTREAYFKAIEAGPDDKTNGYPDYWRTRQLKLIRQHLTDAEKTRFSHLPIFVDDEFEEITFLTHTRSFTGPTSAYTKDDLAQLAVSECVERIKEWLPQKTHFSPSRTGLGRVLQSVVRERAEEYSAAAGLFDIETIHPIYIAHYFRGINEVIRNQMRGNGIGDGINAVIDWSSMVMETKKIIDSAKNGNLPSVIKDEEDAWGDEWRDVMQEIASFFELALNQRTQPLPLKLQKTVWECIDYLCQHPDPSPSREQEESKMDPLTLSINCVRGEATYALFAYIYWKDRSKKKDKKPESRVSKDAKEKIKTYIATPEQHNIVTHTAYGANYMWLLVYDAELAISIKDVLFTNNPVGTAAWNAYLANKVTEESFRELQSYYEGAIAQLSEVTKSPKKHTDPASHLISHITAAYVHDWDHGSELMEQFMKIANPAQRGEMISQLGRGYILRESRKGDVPIKTEKLEKIWTDRIASSQSDEELKEFGWWVRLGFSEDGWMLEQLIETLRKTRGAIDGVHNVIKTISALTDKLPLPCAEAIDLIIRSRAREGFFYRMHEDEITQILTSLYQTGDSSVIKIADKTVDHLTKLGFEKYRRVRLTPSNHKK